MKLKKIIAGMAAATIAATTMAVSVAAADAGKGPNNDDSIIVFGLYMGMTKDEAIANGVLSSDGKEPDDWSTIPVKATIDEIKFDGNVVTPNGDVFVYWQGDEFKLELVNIYNDKCNGGKDAVGKVFTTMPQNTIEVKFTIDGLASNLSGKAYIGGGFRTESNDWTSSFFGNKPDEVNPKGTTFDMPDVTGNGTYTAKVTFPNQGGDTTSTGDTSSTAGTTSSTAGTTSSTAATSSTAETTSSKAGTTNANNTNKPASSTAASDNTAATGATAGIALAGIALAGAAIVVSKRK